MAENTAFIDQVNKIVKSETVSLIQNINAKQNGTLEYNELTDTINELKGLLSHIRQEAIGLLPPHRLRLLVEKLTPIFNQISTIQSTPVNTSQTIADQKQKTLRFFTYSHPNQPEHYPREKDEIWRIICESITLLNYKNFDDSIIKGKLREVEEASKSIKEIEGQLKSVLQSAQTELSKGGVSTHSLTFQQQADKNKGNADRWRCGAIWLMVATFLVIIVLSLIIIKGLEKEADKIEMGFFSAVIISLLSYSIVLCVKNNFAEKHNQTVNQHKANCLGTYNTFVDSADQERKSAVLLFATQTIFSHQKSGYLAKESDSQTPNPIIEITKKMGTIQEKG